MSCESQDPALTKLRQAAEAGTLTVWILHVSIAEMEHCQLANLQNSTKSCLGQRCPRKAFRSNWHSSGEGFFAAHARIVCLQHTWTLLYIYIYIWYVIWHGRIVWLIHWWCPTRWACGQELVWALDKGYENKRRAAAKMKAMGMSLCVQTADCHLFQCQPQIAARRMSRPKQLDDAWMCRKINLWRVSMCHQLALTLQQG